MSTSASPKRSPSGLQKFILLAAFSVRGRQARSHYLRFYAGRRTRLSRTGQVKVITRALERLITRGLLVGYGAKTAEKWYITDIRLTPAGKKLARRLQGEQQSLPLHAYAEKKEKRKSSDAPGPDPQAS